MAAAPSTTDHNVQRLLESIAEITEWLKLAKMDQFVYLLVDNGYDDLDAISQCNDLELSGVCVCVCDVCVCVMCVCVWCMCVWWKKSVCVCVCVCVYVYE